MTPLHLIIFACVLSIALLILYLGVAAWNAKHHVANQPRQDMYICDTHGPMPIGVTITVFNGNMEYETEGRAVRGPVRACPICFSAKIQKAKEQWNKK
jgi:hypothetical protein